MNRTEIFRNYDKIVGICDGDYDLADEVVLDLITREDDCLLSYDIVNDSINKVKRKTNEMQEQSAFKDILDEDDTYKLEEIVDAINKLPPQYKELLHKILITGGTIDDVSTNHNIPNPVVAVIFKEGILKLLKFLPDSVIINFINNNTELDTILQLYMKSKELEDIQIILNLKNK